MTRSEVYAMRSDCRTFEEFWTAFANEQRPFRDQVRPPHIVGRALGPSLRSGCERLGRASLSLARLTLRQRGPKRWRWAAAAAVLTAGRLLAGFEDELDTSASSEGTWPDDARSLATGDRPTPKRAGSATRVDDAWAAWL